MVTIPNITKNELFMFWISQKYASYDNIGISTCTVEPHIGDCLGDFPKAVTYVRWSSM